MNRDLFKSIRNRLTLFYTFLMMIFLLASMLISYLILSSIIYQEQKQEVNKLASQEWHEHQEDFLDSDEIEEANEKYENISVRADQDHFYYVVKADGSVLKGREAIPKIRGAILKSIQGWIPEPGEVRMIEVPDQSSKDLHLLIAGKPIYGDGKLLGFVYSGKNVTSMQHILNLLKVIFLALSLGFLFLAGMIGHYMTGRAMIPIHRSFQRQREFVADASHELRTPLSVMQSSLEVIETDKSNIISDFSQIVLDDLKDEVKRMTHLVGELLTLARVDSGTIQLMRTHFDLCPIIDQLVRSFGHLAQRKQISIVSEVPGQLLVYADKDRLTQLLYILLDNALKYTPEKGRVLLGISITGTNRTPLLQMRVEDSGLGIPKEDQERIFERFYRVDKVRSRECGGFGLGLSIAQWIAAAHQGTIDVQSVPNKGSVFTVELPINREV